MQVDLRTLSQLPKYKENLMVSDDTIFSYLTPVAKIDHVEKKVIVEYWYSMTTSKHINYVAKEFNYEVVRKELCI